MYLLKEWLAQVENYGVDAGASNGATSMGLSTGLLNITDGLVYNIHPERIAKYIEHADDTVYFLLEDQYESAPSSGRAYQYCSVLSLSRIL